MTEEPRAYYNIKTDRIHMPPIDTFHQAAGYYGTLAHELTHWTGATKRLDRFGRFNDRKSYAFEELVAVDYIMARSAQAERMAAE